MTLLKAVNFVANLFKKNTLKNVNLMRETVSGLLKKQGVDAKLNGDFLEFNYKNVSYKVVFDLEDNYPVCELILGISDNSYVSLNTDARSVAINRYNQDCDDDVKVTARDSFVGFQTTFSFYNHQMLRDLFTSRLNLMDSSCQEFITKFVKGELVPSKTEKRTIGFYSAMYRDSAK